LRKKKAALNIQKLPLYCQPGFDAFQSDTNNFIEYQNQIRHSVTIMDEDKNKVIP
jgi:hypothetical protein